MRHFLATLLLALLPFAAQAQNVKFGYINLTEALKAMPAYAATQDSLKQLAAQYAAETKRVEDEFNAKYEEFLEGQRAFAPAILQKRRAELQEMMQKNIAFKQEAQRLLQQAEDEALAPVKAKLMAAVRKVGMQQALTAVLNSADDATPYFDPNLAVDITADVLAEAAK